MSKIIRATVLFAFFSICLLSASADTDDEEHHHDHPSAAHQGWVAEFVKLDTGNLRFGDALSWGQCVNVDNLCKENISIM